MGQLACNLSLRRKLKLQANWLSIYPSPATLGAASLGPQKLKHVAVFTTAHLFLKMDLPSAWKILIDASNEDLLQLATLERAQIDEMTNKLRLLTLLLASQPSTIPTVADHVSTVGCNGTPSLPYPSPDRAYISTVNCNSTSPPLPPCSSTDETSDVTAINTPPPLQDCSSTDEASDITAINTPPPLLDCSSTDEASDITAPPPPLLPCSSTDEASDVTAINTPLPLPDCFSTDEASDVTAINTPPPLPPCSSTDKASDVTTINTTLPLRPCSPTGDVTAINTPLPLLNCSSNTDKASAVTTIKTALCLRACSVTKCAQLLRTLNSYYIKAEKFTCEEVKAAVGDPPHRQRDYRLVDISQSTKSHSESDQGRFRATLAERSLALAFEQWELR
jgi:hypothetical protein